MTDPVNDAASKVEDAFKAKLIAYPALAGWTVIIDENGDIALEGEDLNALVMRTTGPAFDPSFEYGSQVLNTLLIDVEATVKEASTNKPRRAREGLAHAHAAIMADYTFDGMLQDITEVDVAVDGPGVRDHAAVSMQFSILYFTPRNDLTTILGVGGVEF